MSDVFAGLVDRVVAQLHPLPIVTPAEYAAITCNRCGVCCEDIRRPNGPDALAAEQADPDVDPERKRFISGLQLVSSAGGVWRYRGLHFARDESGLGLCTIHETRPSVCRGFPFGRVIRSWPQCSWYVRVRDEFGNELERVPESVI